MSIDFTAPNESKLDITEDKIVDEVVAAYTEGASVGWTACSIP